MYESKNVTSNWFISLIITYFVLLDLCVYGPDRSYLVLRDRGATLRLEGRGRAPLATQYWGGTRHFFLLILYNFKNMGGGGGRARALPAPLTPRSLVLLIVY